MRPSRPKGRALRYRHVTTIVLAFGSLLGCAGPSYLPGGVHMLASSRLSSLVNQASRTYGVSPALVSAVIATESHGDPAAVSRAGAEGLMQLMPATSAQYGVFNPFDPADNVAAGTHYLADLLRRYNGDLKLALAAYNAGPGAVAVARGVPDYRETQAYVARVITALH